MVRTTKGPGEKSKPKKVGAKAPAEKEQMARPADLDDATWDQVQALARNQQTTTGEVIRRAIIAAFGQAQPQGAINSGLPSDPNRQ